MNKFLALALVFLGLIQLGQAIRSLQYTDDSYDSYGGDSYEEESGKFAPPGIFKDHKPRNNGKKKGHLNCHWECEDEDGNVEYHDADYAGDDGSYTDGDMYWALSAF